MEITIHFSGTIDDLQRVEEMEDRVTDLVFALGGKATIWRSYADHDPTRVMRGLLVDMAPGQETLSLLVSPEGHLTPLFQIEDAEKQPFDKPPYCSVKTQFGSIQGHIAVVLLLDALKQSYCSNMKITDESGYAENRDIGDLKHNKEFLAGAIRAMADGINAHQLSSEAAEDPNIVASRIERVTRLVHQKMRGESATRNQKTEDPLDVENDFDAPLEEQVAEMEVLRRKNNLRSERMLRRITETTASGRTVEEAFRLAMEEEGLGEFPSSDSDSRSKDDNGDARQDVEPWQKSLSSPSFAAADDLQQRDTHPAVIQAQKFLMQIMNLNSDHSTHDSFLIVRVMQKHIQSMSQQPIDIPAKVAVAILNRQRPPRHLRPRRLSLRKRSRTTNRSTGGSSGNEKNDSSQRAPRRGTTAPHHFLRFHFSAIPTLTGMYSGRTSS